MSEICQIKINSDFSVPLWEWCNLRAENNYVYKKTGVFEDENEDPIVITGDDFVLRIYDNDDTLIDTLTIGNGLEITDDNHLTITVGPPVTDDAETKTGTLDWDKGTTGEFTPFTDFKFTFD